METPNEIALTVDDEQTISVFDDPYSARIRCDHPPIVDGAALAEALIGLAGTMDRGRVVVLARERLGEGLEAAGMAHEATMPGFYRGAEDCVVMGYAADAEREQLANPVEVARVMDLIGEPSRRNHPPVATTRAIAEDAPEIAALLGETFTAYPTPSHDPDYVAEQIREGTPFRLIHDGDQLLACASADLVHDARTAELTDCATRPEARGRGYMQSILNDLMDDLRALSYPTAFTLARARIPGVNLAFDRLGFSFRGTMRQSCRIGDGIEDMNVWSRVL